MTKKAVEMKPNKKNVAPSSLVGQLKELLLLGNYAKARSVATGALNSKDDADFAFINQVLRITWPDPIALLTGLACLAATVAVAFLVAY